MKINEIVTEAISRRDFIKGIAGAGAATAAGKASAIAGAFPSPSTRQKWADDAAASNRAMAAQEAERQRQSNAAKAAKLDRDTKDVERLNKVSYHGKDAPKPSNAEWDGDSDFLELDDTKYAKASRMPISGDEPSDMKLIATKEGRQVYIWTRRSLKGVQGHYFYPAEKPKTINELAPNDGGGSGKFIPWNSFVDQLKQILHKDFDCKESINMDVIKAKFVPYDPMEYGPTQIYSYFERRAGRKGANSVRGQIQVGKFTKGQSGLMTGYHLLKGTEFERYFDLTFENLYKIANIIKGNTAGALELPNQVNE
jgi:hypothetical protein